MLSRFFPFIPYGYLIANQGHCLRRDAETLSGASWTRDRWTRSRNGDPTSPPVEPRGPYGGSEAAAHRDHAASLPICTSAETGGVEFLQPWEMRDAFQTICGYPNEPSAVGV